MAEREEVDEPQQINETETILCIRQDAEIQKINTYSNLIATLQEKIDFSKYVLNEINAKRGQKSIDDFYDYKNEPMAVIFNNGVKNE